MSTRTEIKCDGPCKRTIKPSEDIYHWSMSEVHSYYDENDPGLQMERKQLCNSVDLDLCKECRKILDSDYVKLLDSLVSIVDSQ